MSKKKKLEEITYFRYNGFWRLHNTNTDSSWRKLLNDCEVKTFKNKVFFDVVQFDYFRHTQWADFQGIFSKRYYLFKLKDVEKMIKDGNKLNFLSGFFIHKTHGERIYISYVGPLNESNKLKYEFVEGENSIEATTK